MRNVAAILIMLTLTTQPSLGAGCEGVLTLCQETVEAYKGLVAEQDKLILKLTEQRNALAERPSQTPWYFWVIVGAAGALVVDHVRR